MTDLFGESDAAGRRPGRASRGSGATSRRRSTGTRWRPRAVLAAVGVALVGGVVGAAALATGPGVPDAGASAQVHVTTVSVSSPRYRPHAAVGATDDYHCSLVNPHITQNSYVI